MIGTSIFCNPLLVNDLFPQNGRQLSLDGLDDGGVEEDTDSLLSPLQTKDFLEDDNSSNGESESYSPNTANTSRSPSFNEVPEGSTTSSAEEECEDSGDLSRCGFFAVSAVPTVTEEPVPSTFDEIKAALRRCEGHPFLNIPQQQTSRDLERLNRHLTESTRLAMDNALRGEDRLVSIKLLLHEAHRLHIDRVRRQQQNGLRRPDALTEEEIHHQWSEVALQVEAAAEVGSCEFIQRRLSCMCLFNSQSDIRVYSDNDGFRLWKVTRQREVLARLQAQRDEGKSAFFLEE